MGRWFSAGTGFAVVDDGVLVSSIDRNAAEFDMSNWGKGGLYVHLVERNSGTTVDWIGFTQEQERTAKLSIKPA